jgi:hypothetical protein
MSQRPKRTQIPRIRLVGDEENIRRKPLRQAVEASLDRADDHSQQRNAIDENDRVLRDGDQPFLHDKLRRDWPLTL